jgi:outer membrane protein assembly factor BamB
MTRRATAIALLTLLLSGCAELAFSPYFRDNTLGDIKAARAGMPAPRSGPINATGKPLVFLVTEKPTSIVAYDIAGKKKLWQVQGEVTSKVVVGRDRIFHRAKGKTVMARSISSGQPLWTASIEDGDRLVGMTTDGTNLYYVTEYIKRTFTGIAAHMVALNGATGAKLWAHDSKGRLGAPTATKGYVILPLRSQSVAVLDALKGIEVARIRSTEEMLLWTHTSERGVLYGGRSGIYRLDEKSVSGTREESDFLAASLPPSVRPVYWWDGYNAALSDYTAYDRNRLLWKLAPGKEMAFLDDTIYVHNYRFFFAFDTAKKASDSSTNLKWAYSFPRHDVVASTHTGKALVMVANNGTLVELDLHQGVPVGETKLALDVRGASFDTRGYAPEGKARSKPDLRASLTEVIWDPDRRFGAVKLFAVKQLARLPGKTVSADLVKIVTYEKIDPAVYKLAGQMIVDRHDKAAIPLYLKTLRTHYDFLNESRGQAVDIMARALADLKVKRAIKPLIKHLMDHETSLPAIEAIVKALITIGDKSAVKPLRDFLLTYRADPMFQKSSLILNLIADGLLKLGGEEERQLLRFVGNDSQTIKPLRRYLAEALKQT